MKRFVFLLLAVSTFSFVTNAGGAALASSFKEIKEKDRYTFMLCGYDDAAENTDAIVLFDYDLDHNSASFIQIPRDTYVTTKYASGKINSVYPSLRASGYGQEAAMDKLAEVVSELVGTPIDGYAGYTINGLARLIDNLGGIELEMPFDFSIADENGEYTLKLKKGINHLSGQQAVMFVRHRKGYALGDLARVDAQKIFLASFIKQIKNSINFPTAIKLAFNSGDGVYTNCKAMDILNIALKIRGRLSSAYVKYANLPGMAVESSGGAWYYIVNRPASLKMLGAIGFKTQLGFDPSNRFVNTDDAKLREIYYKEDFEWRIYDDGSLSSVKTKLN